MFADQLPVWIGPDYVKHDKICGAGSFCAKWCSRDVVKLAVGGLLRCAAMAIVMAMVMATTKKLQMQIGTRFQNSSVTLQVGSLGRTGLPISPWV